MAIQDLFDFIQEYKLKEAWRKYIRKRKEEIL